MLKVQRNRKYLIYALRILKFIMHNMPIWFKNL